MKISQIFFFFSFLFHCSLSDTQLSEKFITQITITNTPPAFLWNFCPEKTKIFAFVSHIVAPSTRYRLLRAELQSLRQRSALKIGSSLDRPVIIECNRACARCRTYLGRVINRGAPCRACKLRVCKGCREFTNRTDWVCVVCNKQM
jgi:FYVE-type zinc finger